MINFREIQGEMLTLLSLITLMPWKMAGYDTTYIYAEKQKGVALVWPALQRIPSF